MLRSYDPFGNMPHDQISRARFFAQLRHAAAGVLDPELVAGAAVVGLVALTEGAHVHHEDVRLDLGIMFPRQGGFLCGVHAAHGRAVVVVLIARPDALQEGYTPRRRAVRWTDDVPSGRARGREPALELQGGEAVGVAPQAQLGRPRALLRLVPRG